MAFDMSNHIERESPEVGKLYCYHTKRDVSTFQFQRESKEDGAVLPVTSCVVLLAPVKGEYLKKFLQEGPSPRKELPVPFFVPLEFNFQLNLRRTNSDWH